MVVFWEIFGIYFQIFSFITEVYLEPSRKSMFLAEIVKPKSSILSIWLGSKYASALVMNFFKYSSVSALSWVNDEKLKK